MNNQYLTLPSFSFFNGDFTVTAWSYVYAYTTTQRILDCVANSGAMEFWLNNCFGPSGGYYGPSGGPVATPYPMATTYNTGSSIGHVGIFTYSSLGTKQWGHVAYTMKGTTGTIYINGTLGQSSQEPPLTAYSGSYCYFGKAYNTDPNSKAYFDDVRPHIHYLISLLMC